MRRRLRRLTDRDWRVLDRVLVGGIVVLLVLDVALSNAREGPVVLNLLVLGVAALSLLWRRERPLVPAVVVPACLAALQVFLTAPPDLVTAIVLLVIASYSVAAHSDRRRLAFLGLAIMVVTVSVVAGIYDPSDVIFPVGMFVIVPWLVGRTLRNHTMLARELAEKAERAEHAREEDEQRAIADERARVARELHDVLAHNLSVMVIQASAGRRVIDRDPGAAVKAAEQITATGREALAELRHLFGPVRRGEDDVLDASPGLDHLDRLAARARRAGLDIDLNVEGSPAKLPPGADMAAYRVVQEALTNTIKHGGGAQATINVRYEPGDVVIEVLDDGSGSSSNGSSLESGGHGLVGMRERVALYGGRLDAGKRPDGGFAVRARLPVGGALA